MTMLTANTFVKMFAFLKGLAYRSVGRNSHAERVNRNL
jgi:hypothetical protein